MSAVARQQLLVPRYVNRWAHLIDLGDWDLSWEIRPGLILAQTKIGSVTWFYARTTFNRAEKRAKLLLSSPVNRDPSALERSVIHELIHLSSPAFEEDHLHSWIYSLEWIFQRMYRAGRFEAIQAELATYKEAA